MIIDGTKIAKEREAKLKIKEIVPCLGIIVFDNDRAGQVYTRLKAEAAGRLGIRVAISNSGSVLEKWNQDNFIHGILVQWPGYRGKNEEKKWRRLVEKIKPEKDVDGLRPDSKFTPATVKAVELLIDKFANDRCQKHILVVGRGMIGQGLAKRLRAKNISSKDPNLIKMSLEADILISCSGRQGLIKTVKPGAVVIDVGWPKGDVEFDAVKKIAGAITPVPGGVGPLTVICLLENLVKAVYNQAL